jgi:branched-chain amino acid aminotransferase
MTNDTLLYRQVNPQFMADDLPTSQAFKPFPGDVGKLSVYDGELITPEGRNILRGISRDYVIDIARRLGIPCHERNIEPYDVYTADEAFLTATPFCILPTTHLNGAPIGDGRMGEMTRLLLDTWSEDVGVDIIGQIRAYATEVASLSRPAAPTPYQFRPR